MKKLLTALIAFVMCFSVVTTAFAATPDETSDPDLISDIKQAMLHIMAMKSLILLK